MQKFLFFFFLYLTKKHFVVLVLFVMLCLYKTGESYNFNSCTDRHSR